MRRISVRKVPVFRSRLIQLSRFAELVCDPELRRRGRRSPSPFRRHLAQIIDRRRRGQRLLGALPLALLHKKIHAPDAHAEERRVHGAHDEPPVLNPERQHVELLRWRRSSRRRGGRFTAGGNWFRKIGLRCRFGHRAAESARPVTKGKRAEREKERIPAMRGQSKQPGPRPRR